MDIYFSFKEIISAFMVLFAVIDILGAIPIIISLREKNQKIEAGKAAIISFVILVAFLFIGQALLGLFNVDISSFAVAGALVLLVLAVEMFLPGIRQPDNRIFFSLFFLVSDSGQHLRIRRID